MPLFKQVKRTYTQLSYIFSDNYIYAKVQKPRSGRTHTKLVIVVDSGNETN